MSDWTVTEAGFGFDLGAEKFFDIKCVSAGLDPAAVVLVATIRALKRHGGIKTKELELTDPAAVERGLGNLEKHVENIRTFEENPIVALNRFHTDSDEEIEVVRACCKALDVPFAVSNIYAEGGEGGIELAEAVVKHSHSPDRKFKPLYDWSEPIKVKMEKVATKMYGASAVRYTNAAEKDLKELERTWLCRIAAFGSQDTNFTDR